MRRVCLVILLCACAVGMLACSKEKQVNGEKELLWNGLYSDENQWYLSSRVAESEQGFYMTINDYGAYVTLVYFDKASRTAVPLCNQPDCDHQTLSCDACMKNYAPQVYYYEGKLYLLSYDEEYSYLERMNPDGSERMRIRTMATLPNVNWTLIMHCGIFYYRYNGKLCALGFAEDLVSEKHITEIPDTAIMNQLFAKGDYVYWSYAYIKDQETKTAESVAFRYHIPTGEVEELLRLPQGTFVDISPIADDEIYYYEVDRGLCCYHPSTKTSEVVYEETGRAAIAAYTGGNSLYVVNWRALKLDEEYEEIKVLEDCTSVTKVFQAEESIGERGFLDAHYGGNDEFLFCWHNSRLHYMDLTEDVLSWQSTGLEGK